MAITVNANGNNFDRSTIRVRAGDQVAATFQNNDSGVEHNLSFSLPGLGHGETCKGPCSTSQTFTARTAGSFFFFCTLHPISGDFIVDP